MAQEMEHCIRCIRFFDSKHRYKIIKLSKNHRTYAKLIHRLVAEAFIPNPKKFTGSQSQR